MLSAAEILEICALVNSESESGMDEFWNRQGQSAKVIGEVLDFLEIDEDDRVTFEAALCVGYGIGRGVHEAQTPISYN